MRALACLLLVAAVSSADTAALDALLRQLAAPDAPVRQKATADLVEKCDALGEAGRRWLDAADAAADPEVRKRLAVVRHELDLRDRVRYLLGLLARAGLPDASRTPFVRARAEKGWLVAKGRLVDLALREWRVDATLPAPFEEAARDALRRSHEERRRGAGPAALERLAFRDVLMALWTWQRDDKRLAIEFMREANRVLRRRNTAQPLSTFIRAHAAGLLAERAVLAANEGEPRPRLVERWRAVQAVKGPGFVARDFLQAYASLVKEDADPPSPDTGAVYWAFRLRDSRAGPPELGPPDDPARRLLALRWEAVPALIERLQDNRPTRGLAHGAPRLVSHGDLCRHLLARITGRTFRSRGRAEDWWRDVQERGVDRHLRDKLEDPDRRVLAARELLARDPAAWGPRLLALAWKREARLLPLVAERLRDEDRPRVVSLLERPERDVVVAAARTLWRRWGDDRGLLRLLGALEHEGDAWAKGDAGDVALLCEGRTDAVVEGIARLLARGQAQTRARLVRHVHVARDPRVLDALLRLTRDRVSWAEVGSDRGRLCDWAAVAIARLLRWDDLALLEEEDVRNRQLDRFAARVEKVRARIDWDTLRR